MGWGNHHASWDDAESWAIAHAAMHSPESERINDEMDRETITEEEKAEIDSFYEHPTLEGLERAKDSLSYVMRLGALTAEGIITLEDSRRLALQRGVILK